jgi:hypothetical protein
MKKFMILSVFVCALYINGLCQNLDGPVLKKELVGKYTGGLKNRIAQGKGTAIGLDTYTGNFRKGLPNGEGTYKDSEGNIFKGSFVNGKKQGKGELILSGLVKDMILKGYWESDKYIGNNIDAQYEISNKTGSVTPRIFSVGAGNKVELTIIDPVTDEYITGYIALKGEASLRTTFGMYYYEDATFPLEFDIRYDCNNKIGTSTTANTIRIKINKPGYWVVILKN